MTAQLTKARAKARLLQARADIAATIGNAQRTLQEQYRLLEINTELYEGVCGETPPPVEFETYVGAAS